MEVLSAPNFPTIGTKQEHDAVLSRSWVWRNSIPEPDDPDPVPLCFFRQHPRPMHQAFFKLHALSDSDQRLVLGMRHTLHAPKAEPAPPGQCVGQFETIVQKKANGVVGHV